ncbi:MAG: uroporphyrinogen decarboxylase family protein [Nitrospirota bacterium]
MKPRERFLMALNHKEPDRVPQLIRWGKEIGERLSQIFGVSGEDLGPRIGNDAIVCQVGINALMEMSVGDLVEGETFTSEWGVVYQRQSGFNNPIKHPLENKENLDTYQWPNPNDPRRLNEIRRVMKKYHDDYVVIVDLSSSLYEASMAHLRGMEKFILDSYDDPDWVGRVLDGLADYYIVLGTHAVNEGVDIIRIGDDVGTQMGLLIPPDLWRKLVKPRLGRMIKAFKKANPEIIILYHSCGDFSLIFDDLIELGVGFISTMQPTGVQSDYVAIKKRYGNRLAFKGGLDTQQLLPQGTPAEIREEVKRLLSAYAPGGGYVFMPAHLLYQDVPTENIWAMMEALKDYGKYPLKI